MDIRGSPTGVANSENEWGLGMASSEELREAFKAGFIAERADAIGDDKAFNLDWKAKGLEERVDQHFSRWQELMLWEKGKK